jgi:hypothetical protein
VQNPEDVEWASDFGGDATGFIFAFQALGHGRYDPLGIMRNSPELLSNAAHKHLPMIANNPI